LRLICSRSIQTIGRTFSSSDTTTAYPSTVLRAGVGAIYERDNGTTVRKYYYACGVRVAMRSGGQTYYLLGDHLGGTNITANSSGAQISKLLYKPWGETRFSTGTTPTTWRFTGQREDATIGLYFFNARYLDPQLGRFAQADTIVPEPGDPQALNRYSYVGNRPTVAIDPTGHDLMIVGGYGGDLDIKIWQEWIMEYKGWSLDKWNEFLGVWSNADDFGARNAALRAEGIGIFNWGGTSSASALTAAKSATTRSMVDELAQQMAGMKDVTLLGWSKGGNLVLQFLWAQKQGRLADAVIPVRAVLLAPGTHPLGVVRFGASWVKNEVPGGWPSTVNICSYGDVACPLTIRNATSNINPPEEEGHGPFRQYAAEVIHSLNVEGHHQAREALEVTPSSN
jgi:RHS repeat-associated protein